MPAPEATERTLFVGIGAQRSGTTWLATYLRAHPEIYVPRIKEMHFFDVRFAGGVAEREKLAAQILVRQRRIAEERASADGAGSTLHEEISARAGMANDDAAYLDFFLTRVGERRVFGEISPSYCMLPGEAFGHIAGLFPRVKFLFVMRNPIDRFWSQVRYRNDRHPGQIAWDDVVGRSEYTLRTDYRRTLSELLKAVPEDDVWVEFYETLFAQAATERLCAFLGVTALPAETATRINGATGRELDPHERQRIYDVFAPVFDYVGERYAARLPDSWKQDIAAHGGGAGR